MTPIEKTLIDLYVQLDTPVDELPYTETLTSITISINTKQSAFITAGTVWCMLVNMRNSGKLPDIRCNMETSKDELVLLDDPFERRVHDEFTQDLNDELMTYANKSLVENVEAIMGGAHASGRWSSEGVIAVVKDAIKMMSKKES